MAAGTGCGRRSSARGKNIGRGISKRSAGDALGKEGERPGGATGKSLSETIRLEVDLFGLLLPFSLAASLPLLEDPGMGQIGNLGD